jgi:hypothetical protein
MHRVFGSSTTRSCRSNIQGCVHGGKCLLGLVKESKHNGRAKFVVTRLVHLQNLLECRQVDGIAKDGFELLDIQHC